MDHEKCDLKSVRVKPLQETGLYHHHELELWASIEDVSLVVAGDKQFKVGRMRLAACLFKTSHYQHCVKTLAEVNQHSRNLIQQN